MVQLYIIIIIYYCVHSKREDTFEHNSSNKYLLFNPSDHAGSVTNTRASEVSVGVGDPSNILAG